MKRFKRIYVALFVLVIAMGAITACGGGGGGGDAAMVTVTGIALDSNGDPIAGAEVTITSAPVTAFTDSTGTFFAEVVVGVHTVTISMGTYTIFQGNFTVTEGVIFNFGDLDPTSPYFSEGTTWYKDSDADLYSDGISSFGATPPAGFDLAGNLTATSGDCDDTSAAVNPAATEICNSIDDNCADGIDEGLTFDVDSDGYTSIGSCLGSADDCDDSNASVNPAATEICNSIDDNCVAGIDEGLTFDADSDGYTAVGSCGGSADDCNDLSAAINPGATEICNGTDDNCAGGVDEGVTTTFYADGDIDSYGNPLATTQACVAPVGFVADNTDCDDSNAAVNPGETEVCNGVDDNCAGGIDEGVTTTFYADSDSDAYGDSTSSTAACSQPAGYVTDNTDCDDTSAAVNPGETEVCNDIDDNCDGGIDEGLALTTFYYDSDSDAYGDSTSSTDACAQPAGYVADNTDCNDFNAAVNPGATEVCNSIDDNCDGGVDEGVTTTYYADSDVDNYGNPLSTQEACAQPAGYVADNTDCDDGDAAVNPGETEVCNDIDDNCDGSVDEGVTTTFYADADTDTFGAATASTEACAQPAGYVSNDTDCDDTNAAVNPAATEVCNGVDDNCVGGVDEGLSFDVDADGYTSTDSCAGSKDDCNDFNLAVNPAATEVCNGIDDNCVGGIDEGVSTTFYNDSDLDTFGDPLVSQAVCAQPAGYVTDNTDCDDGNAAINPAAIEVVNNTDDNCDGNTDEGFTWYRDADLDGYSSGATSTWPPDPDYDFLHSKDDPSSPLLATDGDCNDSNSNINPGEKNCWSLPGYGQELIPSGCFTMGDSYGDGDSDEITHSVCITSGFYMDRYEVTNAQYAACMSAGACTTPPADFSNTRSNYYGNSEYDNFPVIYVDWNSAAAYCSWQGMRLPTEAEWEYAARGGAQFKKYPWATDTLDAGNYANYDTSAESFDDVWVPEDTSPVGFYVFDGVDPNGYGLYDMAGNVHEWVSDWYSSTYYGVSPLNDPENTTPTTARAERGGAWISPEHSIRVSARHEQTPTSPDSTIGIRCVYNP